MADETLNKFLGKGISFPLVLNEKGRPDIDTETDLIKSSIQNILSWPLQDRFFLQNFGSRIFELIEEPNDQITKSLVKEFTLDSISQWEKRITLLGIEITSADDTKINIQINYRINSNKVEDSFIFPFYRNIIY